MSTTKRYHSFDEIEEQLKILRLQREIDKETLKLHLSNAKATLSPTQFFGGASGILKKYILVLFIKRIKRLFQKDRLT